jgi:hypothetical protein
VAQLALGQALLGGRAEGQLHGVVAVALAFLDGGHEAGAGLEHGHALHVPVLGIEDLGHAQLAS